MSFTNVKTDMTGRLLKTEESLKKDFSTLRTGRANPSILDNVMVNAYGSMMPLNQVGTVSVPEARMLSVTVWDRGLMKDVEKAIVEAGIGLNPMNDGTLIRLPIPPLSEERRLEIIKVAHKFTEAARVSVRNIRRDAMDTLKAMKAKNEISEDDQKRYEKEVQEMTDKAVAALEGHLKKKEEEIKIV